MTEDSKPFAGRRIVVTRAREQASGVLSALRAAGAEAISLPTIAFAPPAEWAPLDAALARLAEYDGLIFTSANGVRAFFRRGQALGLAPARPARAWLCAIGPATAAALAEQGWRADIIPADYVAEGVAAALAGRELRGRRILLPRAAAARDALTRALAAAGAEVDVVAAYRTELPARARAQARRLFPAGPGPRPDTVLFTSSSTAENLARLLGEDYRERLAGVLLASIGPVTSATLRRLGLEAGIEAREFTTDGLLAALASGAPRPRRAPGANSST